MKMERQLGISQPKLKLAYVQLVTFPNSRDRKQATPLHLYRK